MFRALLAHPQEAQKSGTWYTACVLCQLAAPGSKWNTLIRAQPGAFENRLYRKESGSQDGRRNIIVPKTIFQGAL
jgi:hypothetical protein